MRSMAVSVLVCFVLAVSEYPIGTSVSDAKTTPAAKAKVATEVSVKMKAFEDKKAEVVKVTVVKEEIRIKRGETFRVRLESNRTTGYNWQVLGPDYDPLQLKKAYFEEKRPDEKKNGAEGTKKHPRFGRPGTQVFEFLARKDGDGSSIEQTVLVFNYGRPWEGLGSECYELTVKIDP